MTAPAKANGIVFQKAERGRQKLKIGVDGPSGSGKTIGALALATNLLPLLAPGKRIAVIDSENESASLYADQFDFDCVNIEADYLTAKYIDAIRAAEAAGYGILVVDSISPQWDGPGGILQRKDLADEKPGSNRWTNWNPFSEEHNEFREVIIRSKLHIIFTLRSKQAYQQVGSGRDSKIEKLGLQPIQREGLEYEFTLNFNVAMDHKADATKDRTSRFDKKRWDLTKPETAKAVADWLLSGNALAESAPSVPGREMPRAADAAEAQADIAPRPADVREWVLPFGKTPPAGNRGRKLGEIETPALSKMLEWFRAPARDGGFDEWIKACDKVLDQRAMEADEQRALELCNGGQGLTTAEREASEAEDLPGVSDPMAPAPAEELAPVAVGGFDEIPEALALDEDDDLPS